MIENLRMTGRQYKKIEKDRSKNREQQINYIDTYRHMTRKRYIQAYK